MHRNNNGKKEGYPTTSTKTGHSSVSRDCCVENEDHRIHRKRNWASALLRHLPNSADDSLEQVQVLLETSLFPVNVHRGEVRVNGLRFLLQKPFWRPPPKFHWHFWGSPTLTWWFLCRIFLTSSPQGRCSSFTSTPHALRSSQPLSRTGSVPCSKPGQRILPSLFCT